MAKGRPHKYSMEDRSRVYVALKSNGDNLKRTSREEGVPENTIRRWREDWKNGINVPDIDKVEAAYAGFIEDAERVRNKAIKIIEEQLPDAKIKELIVVVGVLDDKITRSKGIDRDRNLHVHHHLPSAEELRGLMGEFVQTQIDSANEEDVIDGEYTPSPLALPA